MAPRPPATPVMPAADAERQRLVQRDVDAHGGRRDLVVADRHEGAPRARLQQIDGEDVDRDRDGEREIIQPHVLRYRQAERRIGFGHHQALHAAGPFLEIAELQKLRHRGCQCKGGQRQIDAGETQRRLAEQKPETETDDAGDRQRQRVIHAAMFHQDRRGVGADRVESALAQRKLPAAAGQDVQRQHGEAVDQQHRELEDDEILHEQRRADQQHQHDQRGAVAERHGPLGNGLDGRGFGDDFLNCAHDQTRFTMGRPNRPAGLTTRTVMISASAIGSFSSLPTPGM